jgi:hypothetical protein
MTTFLDSMVIRDEQLFRTEAVGVTDDNDVYGVQGEEDIGVNGNEGDREGDDHRIEIDKKTKQNQVFIKLLIIFF